MDYQTIESGTSLPRGFTLIKKLNGDPIVSGTVNYYLRALTGTQAGNWWRDSDQTWQAAETGNPMSLQADGHWLRSLAASPWASGVSYLEYAKESGNLHVPTSRFLRSDYVQSTGVGARTVVVTVNDGATALQGAYVRMTKGVESYISQTDAVGQTVFNLNDGTWAVAVALAGYSFAGASLVITGSTATTYSMTQQVITPSPAGFTTGFLVAYDQYGATEQGVSVSIQIKEGVGGVTADETTRAVQSDVNGLVQFTGMLKGAVYFVWRGTSPRKYTVTIPVSAGTTYALPSVIGAP